MYTAAAVSMGSSFPGRRKMTIWLKWGREGNLNANWVGEIVRREVWVRTGREGRMRPNII